MKKYIWGRTIVPIDMWNSLITLQESLRTSINWSYAKTSFSTLAGASLFSKTILNLLWQYCIHLHLGFRFISSFCILKQCICKLTTCNLEHEKTQMQPINYFQHPGSCEWSYWICQQILVVSYDSSRTAVFNNTPDPTTIIKLTR